MTFKEARRGARERRPREAPERGARERRPRGSGEEGAVRTGRNEVASGRMGDKKPGDTRTGRVSRGNGGSGGNGSLMTLIRWKEAVDWGSHTR